MKCGEAEKLSTFEESNENHRLRSLFLLFQSLNKSEEKILAPFFLTCWRIDFVFSENRKETRIEKRKVDRFCFHFAKS